MVHYKAFTGSENDHPLNRAALEWLKEAKVSAPDHYMHLLNLAHWGLVIGLRNGWKNQSALRDQVDGLFGWKAANALAWLLNNPNGSEDQEEQSASLLRLLETSANAENAAHHVLETIYSRQQAENSNLQPAQSELR